MYNMGFKYLKKNAVSITLLFAMVLNLTAIQPVNVFANEVQKKTETAVPVDKEEKTENQPSQSNNVTNEYNSTDKQDISKLLEQQKFTVSNPDISMKTYEKWNGVLIKGNYSSITESTFTFEEELDFRTQDITNYIVADGLAAKKRTLYWIFTWIMKKKLLLQ